MAKACVPCTEGMDCVGIGNSVASLQLKAGFYRASEDTEEVIKCPFPDACDDLDCTLTLAGTEVELPAASFWTRAFDGGLPGPTLRARAGDTLRVKYVNDLKDKDNDDRSMNEMRQVNTSNLHVHGLHVSSKAPGDDIFTVVDPESSYDFEYEIPDFHMGGTHWYHPHHHGSTALQAGGGAFGEEDVV